MRLRSNNSTVHKRTLRPYYIRTFNKCRLADISNRRPIAKTSLELPTMKPSLRCLSLAAVGSSILVAVVFLSFPSGPEPTEEERNQMNSLADWSFVFGGTTNTIRRARTISAFDEQHELIPYLRLVSTWFDKYSYLKGRPVDVTLHGDIIVVTWPVRPEIELFLWRADYSLRIRIDKKEMVVLGVTAGG